jgi:hypothetical protein
LVWPKIDAYNVTEKEFETNEIKLKTVKKDLESSASLYATKSPQVIKALSDKTKKEIDDLLYNSTVGAYVSPENVTSVFSQIFNDKAGDITIIKIDTATTLLKEDTANKEFYKNMPVIYKHTFDIIVQGDYNAIFDFIQKFEDINFIHLDELNFKALEYPKNEVELKLYVENSSKDLINIKAKESE